MIRYHDIQTQALFLLQNEQAFIQIYHLNISYSCMYHTHLVTGNPQSSLYVNYVIMALMWVPFSAFSWLQ